MVFKKYISFVLSECYRNTCIMLLKYFSNNTTRICYVKHLICFLDVNCLLHLVLTSSSSFFCRLIHIFAISFKRDKNRVTFHYLNAKIKKKPFSPVACSTLIHLPIYFFFINDQIYLYFFLTFQLYSNILCIGKNGVGSAVYLSCLLTVLS